MKSRASLKLVLSGVEVREALGSVLAADNEGAPPGLRLSVRERGAAIEFLAESDSASVSISTVLGILRDVSLFEEVWLLSHRRPARVQRA